MSANKQSRPPLRRRRFPYAEHQTECLAQIDEALAAGESRIVVKIPTGGGKTKLASAFILRKRYLEFGARVGFWMPRLNLVEQMIKAFHEAGIAHAGVIQGKHRLPKGWASTITGSSTRPRSRTSSRKNPVSVVVFAPPGPDLSQVRTVAGDYHEGDLSTVCDTKILVANIVTTWKLRGEGRPTILFAIDRKMSRAKVADCGLRRAKRI